MASASVGGSPSCGFSFLHEAKENIPKASSENNIVFNSGKNGIHFDHSDAASGIIRNNTLYFNGSHNLIQLEEHGQLLHNGPNQVAGINSRNTAAVTITNNIVVTRDNQYTSIGLYNIPTKLVKNNLFVDASMAGTNMVGTSPLDSSNMLNNPGL